MVTNKTANSALDTSTGIYTIPFKERRKFYIGETGRALDKRVSEHEIGTLGNLIPVSIYVPDGSHMLNWNNASIIFKIF